MASWQEIFWKKRGMAAKKAFLALSPANQRRLNIMLHRQMLRREEDRRTFWFQFTAGALLGGATWLLPKGLRTIIRISSTLGVLRSYIATGELPFSLPAMAGFLLASGFTGTMRAAGQAAGAAVDLPRDLLETAQTWYGYYQSAADFYGRLAAVHRATMTRAFGNYVWPWAPVAQGGSAVWHAAVGD